MCDTGETGAHWCGLPARRCAKFFQCWSRRRLLSRVSELLLQWGLHLYKTVRDDSKKRTSSLTLDLNETLPGAAEEHKRGYSNTLTSLD